jgi:signal transduction histidine kinase
VVLVLAWIGGYLLARQSLRPTESMSRSAARISAANLTERLPVGNPQDELGHLATVLNALLGRVQDAFEQQRRFTADASHELRTPITILQNEADIALARSERDSSEYRETISLMRTTTKRMATIVDDLFLLARADSGEQPLRVSHFYLDEMIEECGRSARAIAAQRGTVIRCETESGAEYIGDEGLLRRVILNLLDNAIKYSPPGSAVDISLLQSGARPGSGGRMSPGDHTGPGVQAGSADADAHEASGVYIVSVTDNGPGIPAADQPRIFDRFYRVDSARSRSLTELSGPQPCAAASEPSGAGLGLAISRWVAEAHGGELYLESSTPDGTRFVLVLPRAATSSPG